MQKKLNLFLTCFLLPLLWCPDGLSAQGFLHAAGKQIVNGSGENVILRGIGTGNWMIQEGYMMNSSGIAGTQHEFEKRLIESIGKERSDAFYESWLSNHFQKTDVDSMAAWGFNCVRVALHYKWFTPPIQEEPVPGEITWKDKGFDLVDSLLSWCQANQIYLILDLHGAPGGQGKDANISDYDSNLPSLWESELNKEKTVALWKKLAERYSDEPWMGGYDLINETNWAFEQGSNSPLRDLYVRITQAIREVDRNHLIIIEGNWFANDFSGLTPPWDSNLAYSFHKYWSYNTENSIDWVLNLRDEFQVPIWLGEAGENSNTWFTNLVSLLESNNIGWSWWPVKKGGINNILRVVENADYTQLINSWKGQGTVSADQAYEAVIKFSEQHRFENCVIQYDVIDALIRQPQTTATKAFKNHKTLEWINGSDYDLGRNGYAYYDTDTADYHLNTNEFGEWNTGWVYRSDGVDLQGCSDEAVSSGYCVAWIKTGEWLQFTLTSDTEGAYRMPVRVAVSETATMYVEVNGKRASRSIELSPTGGYDQWRTFTIESVILPKGLVKIRLVFESSGLNFGAFQLIEPVPVEEIPFEMLSGASDRVNNSIYLDLNKPISTPDDQLMPSDFQLIVNNGLAPAASLHLSEINDHRLVLVSTRDLYQGDQIKISYQANTIQSQSQSLNSFVGAEIVNQLHQHAELPARVEAESFFSNNGFQVEKCEDIGGGYNMAYANAGDYLDYLLKVPAAGSYRMDFRVAGQNGDSEVLLMLLEGNKMVPKKAVKFSSTGGWQNWHTQSSDLTLPEGKVVLRIYSRNGEFNLNWFSFDGNTQVENQVLPKKFKYSPNPASDRFYLDFPSMEARILELFSMDGKKLLSLSSMDQSVDIDVRPFPTGHYILRLSGDHINETIQLQIAR